MPLFPGYWLFYSQLFSQSGDLIWNIHRVFFFCTQVKIVTILFGKFSKLQETEGKKLEQFTNLHYDLQFNKFLVIPRIVVLTEPGFLWNGRRLCTRCSQWAGRAGCPQLARRSSICICVCGCNCLRICALCSYIYICVFCRRHT